MTTSRTAPSFPVLFFKEATKDFLKFLELVAKPFQLHGRAYPVHGTA